MILQRYKNVSFEFKQKEDQVVEVLSTPSSSPQVDTHLDSDPSRFNRMEEMTEKAKKRPRDISQTNGKRREMTKLPSKEMRYDRIDHLPGVRANKSRNRCRFEGCPLKTNHFCMKCKVYLCIKEEKNCFVNFHTFNSEINQLKFP